MAYHELYKEAKSYKKYIRDSLKKTYNILHGPIRSSKSIANIQAFALNMLASPDTLHMVAATTAAVANAVWFENDGLGLAYIFEGSCRKTKYNGLEALVINLPGREITILALGLANAGSYKSFRGMSLGMVGFTEIDLLDPESVEEAIRRTAASKRRRFFMDMNPQGPKHRIYSDDLSYSIDRLRKTIPDQVNYRETTMRDNPILTEERIQEIASEYPEDSLQYKRFILGERVDAEGLIYRVSDWNILESFNPKDYIGYVISADIGQESSATVFILLGITKGFEEVHVLKEYYHKNAGLKAHAIKMPTDYADDYVQFIKESIDLMGSFPDAIYIDHDITFHRELRRSLDKNSMYHVKFKYAIKEDIDDRIKTGINLLWTKKLKFYKECTNTIYAFKSATYDPKESLKGKFVRYDEPTKGTAIDACDVTEYAISHYIKRLYKKYE